MKKMFLALVVALFSTCGFAQEAYLQVTLNNDAVTKISLSDIKDFRFVTVAAAEPEPEVEAVDLGLPSGLKWASFNLGASAPEEYGDYYAWGETETKSEYTASNSKWHGVGYSSLQSEGVIDASGNLTAAYDAANVKLGGKWRMPTLDEMKELKDNTTSEWTTLNGVYGRKVTSNSNSNFIFLPAAGYRFGDALSDEGSSGRCWSATPYSGYANCAYDLYFTSSDFDWGYGDRYLGFAVRPVSE